MADAQSSWKVSAFSERLPNKSLSTSGNVHLISRLSTQRQERQTKIWQCNELLRQTGMILDYSIHLVKYDACSGLNCLSSSQERLWDCTNKHHISELRISWTRTRVASINPDIGAGSITTCIRSEIQERALEFARFTLTTASSQHSVLYFSCHHPRPYSPHWYFVLPNGPGLFRDEIRHLSGNVARRHRVGSGESRPLDSQRPHYRGRGQQPCLNSALTCEPR